MATNEVGNNGKVALVFSSPFPTLQEQNLLAGLRSTYGYERVNVFDSSERAIKFFIENPPRFLICCYNGNNADVIDEIFEQRSLRDGGTTKILAVAAQQMRNELAAERFDHDMLVLLDHPDAADLLLHFTKVIGNLDIEAPKPELTYSGPELANQFDPMGRSSTAIELPPTTH